MKSTFTKFNTDVQTNLPVPLHGLIVDFVEKLEDYFLEANNGKVTLQDVCEKNPELIDWISDVFSFNPRKINTRIGDETVE